MKHSQTRFFILDENHYKILPNSFCTGSKFGHAFEVTSEKEEEEAKEEEKTDKHKDEIGEGRGE